MGGPDESYLFPNLVESDLDQRMPQEGSALSTTQIAVIRRWIKEGARFEGADQTSRLTPLLPPREHSASPDVDRVAIPVFSFRTRARSTSRFPPYRHDAPASEFGGWIHSLAPRAGKLFLHASLSSRHTEIQSGRAVGMNCSSGIQQPVSSCDALDACLSAFSPSPSVRTSRRSPVGC